MDQENALKVATAHHDRDNAGEMLDRNAAVTEADVRRRVMVAPGIAKSIEWYDFVVSCFVASVIAALFFPSSRIASFIPVRVGGWPFHLYQRRHP